MVIVAPGAAEEGLALMEPVGAAESQLLLLGVVAEQVPVHAFVIVPEFVCPHALGAEVQAAPIVYGVAGVGPEQVPSQFTVPPAVPQALMLQLWP